MDWKAAEAALDNACAEAFDKDECRLLPRMRSGGVNSELAADPSRAEFDFMATIELSPERFTLEADRVADPAVRRRQVNAEMVLTANSAAWPHFPRKSDHVQCGADVYVIAELHRDGGQRAAFWLNRAN